jgi:hypothetical protein
MTSFSETTGSIENAIAFLLMKLAGKWEGGALSDIESMDSAKPFIKKAKDIYRKVSDISTEEKLWQGLETFIESNQITPDLRDVMISIGGIPRSIQEEQMVDKDILLEKGFTHVVTLPKDARDKFARWLEESGIEFIEDSDSFFVKTPTRHGAYKVGQKATALANRNADFLEPKRDFDRSPAVKSVDAIGKHKPVLTSEDIVEGKLWKNFKSYHQIVSDVEDMIKQGTDPKEALKSMANEHGTTPTHLETVWEILKKKKFPALAEGTKKVNPKQRDPAGALLAANRKVFGKAGAQGSKKEYKRQEGKKIPDQLDENKYTKPLKGKQMLNETQIGHDLNELTRMRELAGIPGPSLNSKLKEMDVSYEDDEINDLPLDTPVSPMQDLSSAPLPSTEPSIDDFEDEALPMQADLGEPLDMPMDEPMDVPSPMSNSINNSGPAVGSSVEYQDAMSMLSSIQTLVPNLKMSEYKMFVAQLESTMTQVKNLGVDYLRETVLRKKK